MDRKAIAIAVVLVGATFLGGSLFHKTTCPPFEEDAGPPMTSVYVDRLDRPPEAFFGLDNSTLDALSPRVRTLFAEAFNRSGQERDSVRAGVTIERAAYTMGILHMSSMEQTGDKLLTFRYNGTYYRFSNPHAAAFTAPDPIWC